MLGRIHYSYFISRNNENLHQIHGKQALQDLGAGGVAQAWPAVRGGGAREVEIKGSITAAQRHALAAALLKSGLELMNDKKAILIERIKSIIIKIVHYDERDLKTKNSDFISKNIGLDYTYLANLFSETTGITIEHYIIYQKVERVKSFFYTTSLRLHRLLMI
ncbi:MAG: AraC family transcriptional regulator [Hymenobacter sp.]